MNFVDIFFNRYNAFSASTRNGIIGAVKKTPKKNLLLQRSLSLVIIVSDSHKFTEEILIVPVLVSRGKLFDISSALLEYLF